MKSPKPIESRQMDEHENVKRMDRKLKNRLSAKRSRDATKSHILQLEKTNAALTRYVQLLEQRLAFESAANAHLAQVGSCGKQKTSGALEPAALLSLQWILFLFCLSTTSRNATLKQENVILPSHLQQAFNLFLGMHRLQLARSSRKKPASSYVTLRTRRKLRTRILDRRWKGLCPMNWSPLCRSQDLCTFTMKKPCFSSTILNLMTSIPSICFEMQLGTTA
jgi:hypothetical protein